MIPLAAEAGTSIPTSFIALLGGGGIGAILVAIITGLFSRRKLGAEATEIITKAAAGVVTSLEAEVRRQADARRLDAERHNRERAEMAAAHVAERQEWQRVLQLHAAWDAIAIARLAEVDVALPPTPPLTPAQRHVDDQGYPLH